MVTLFSRAMLVLVCGPLTFAATSSAQAAPQLVTPLLPPATESQSYAANLMIGSSVALQSANVIGLPAALTATHNGSGSIAITGIPTVSGNFSLTVTATDNNAGVLNTLVTLQVVTAPQYANAVTSVSAGKTHGCAVVSGGVQCWGSNGNGELGNNSTIQSVVPVQSIPAGSNVTAVSGSYSHNCAVVNGGALCWGWNGNGQLGQQPTFPARSLIPVQSIAAGSNVTAVSAGRDHSCAVVNGGVLCWGNNQYGQLGNNSTLSSVIPVQAIPSGSNVTAVSAGATHSCAVVNGGVQCWGLNFGSLLGNNSAAFRSLIPVQTIPAGSNVTAVSAGESHSCAVVNGGVQCWGKNGNGQLGNNSITESPIPVQTIPAGSNVTVVSAGSTFKISSAIQNRSHSCAVVNGGVQCWGLNFYGQLGNNSTTQSLVPVQTIAAGSNATAVAAGEQHSCAIVSGGAQCWGDNLSGQLGNNSITQSLVPVQSIAAGSSVAAVSAGMNHSCAAVNGGVQCWGNNQYGQFGNNSTTGSRIPVQTVPAGSNVTSASASYSHSCAIVSGGVQCWGDNVSGQLGNNSTAQSLVPVQAIPADSIVTAVSAGGDRSCAVVSGGVQCWGAIFGHRIGNPNFTVSLIPVQSIPAGGNATAVSAGMNHSCAVVNGGVQCWGDNLSGQLGNNSNNPSNTPVQTIPAGSTVAAVSAGGSHSCAVVNGGVQCWGNNGNGQLGNNTITQSPIPVQSIPPGSNTTAVAAGGSHSCAVVNGGVQCWGSNFYGELGNNSITQSPMPVQSIPAGSNVTGISAGNNHSCAVVNSGVVCWGFNGSGQLADANTNSSPVLIPVMTQLFVLSPVVSLNATSLNFAAQNLGITSTAQPVTLTNSGSAALNIISVGAIGDFAVTHTCGASLGIGVSCGLSVTFTPTLAGTRTGAITITSNATGSPHSVNLSGTGNGPPSAPNSVSAIPGDAQATITFSSPFSNGGSPITGYIVSCDAGAVNVPAQNSPVNLTGLTNGTLYSCFVTATNALGVSPPSTSVNVTPSATAPIFLVAVQSRKTHTGIGIFDLPIDTTQTGNGLVTVEPRGIGAGHTIVFQFNVVVGSFGAVSAMDVLSGSSGNVPAILFGNEIIVTLAGIPDNRRVTITLGGVTGPVDSMNAEASIGFLVGDTNNTRSVNSSDISGVKARSGQTTTGANFKFDMNASGAVNSSDISAVKARSGLSLR